MNPQCMTSPVSHILRRVNYHQLGGDKEVKIASFSGNIQISINQP